MALRLSVKIGVDVGSAPRWVNATDRPTSSALLIVFDGPRPQGSILRCSASCGGLRMYTPVPVSVVRESVDGGIHEPSVYIVGTCDEIRSGVQGSH